MNREDTLAQLAQGFHDLAWDSDHPGETVFKCQVQDAGLTLEEVLAEQADETLTVAVQKGFLTQGAFEELFRRYAESHHGEVPLLTRMLQRRSEVNVHDCFDIAQNVFLRCYQMRFASFDPKKGSLSRYLSTWALNDWRTLMKKKRPELLADMEGAESSSSQLEVMVLREKIERVNDAIAALPEQERQVIEFQRDENLNAAELAQRLQLPIKHIYRLNHSARTKLYRTLGWHPPGQRRRRDLSDAN